MSRTERVIWSGFLLILFGWVGGAFGAQVGQYEIPYEVEERLPSLGQWKPGYGPTYRGRMAWKVCSFVDVGTTFIGLDSGEFVEGNPLYSSLSKEPIIAVGVGTVVNYLVYKGIRKISRSVPAGKKRRGFWRWVSVAKCAPAAWNIYVLAK